MPPSVTARSVVHFPLLNKRRTAVVLLICNDAAVVLIHGTGTARDLPRVEVQPESQEGKALGLYKPTYFYGSSVLRIKLSELTLIGRCPPGLFARLVHLWQTAGPP